MTSRSRDALLDDTAGVLYRAANVVTMDPHRPTAEAVATRGGRIISVGSEGDCCRSIGMRETATETTDARGGPAGGGPAGRGPVSRGPGGDQSSAPRVVELAGRTLLPGFHDVHLHPLPMAFFEHHLDLTPCISVAEVLDALADRSAGAAPGEWVMGLRIDEEKLTDHRLPTRAELDSIAPQLPIVLFRRDGHTALGNTAALAGAHIAEDSADPDGGAFDRDVDGSLTGLCRESAAQLLVGAVPVPGIEALREATRRVFNGLATDGITTVGMVLQTDAEGPAGAAGVFECPALQMFIDEIPMASNAILSGAEIENVLAVKASTLHDPATGRRVGGMKIYLDGTLGARTAFMHEAYSDDPTKLGMLTIDEEVCAARMEAAHLAGLQVCIHAIGDSANDLALSLFADLIAKHPGAEGRRLGHRIEHASVLSQPTVERFAELGVIAAVQPLFMRSERDWLGSRLGRVRTKWVYPFRSLLEAGVTVAGASDAPIEETDVLAAIHTAVTRHGFEMEQCIGAEEALRMFTSDAAAASLTDGETGTITEGKRADLVALSGDPTGVSADEILSLEVELTVSGGRDIFRR